MGKVIYGAPSGFATKTLEAGGGEAAASLENEFVSNKRHGTARLTPDEEKSIAIHLPPRALLSNFYTAVFHPVR